MNQEKKAEADKASGAACYEVSLMGFSDPAEQNIIRRFFEMSRSGSRSFGYASNSGGVAGAAAVLLDVDDASAVLAWENAGGARRPTLQIGKQPIDPNLRWVPRPFSLRAIKELDGLVTAFRTDAGSMPQVAVPAVASGMGNVVQLPTANRPRVAQVLIVDDSPIVRSLMELKLLAYGVTVDIATDGETALNMLSKNAYQIVFLDVVMPGMDGYDVCKRIKQDRETRHIEVIMLTSRDGMFDKMRGTMAGCDAYLAKPVNEARLQGLLDKHFKPVR